MIVRRLVQSEMDSVDWVEGSRHRLGVFCDKCPGKIGPNDDCAMIIVRDEASVVMAVADGLGGSPQGHVASAKAMESIEAHIAAAGDTKDWRPAILDAIEHANRDIVALGSGAATTLSIATVIDGLARFFHVGDSMAILVGGGGRIKWQTTSHSPVGYGVAAGILDSIDALTHEDLHIVSNYLGSENMHIDIGPALKLSPRDCIVVASDGLSDNVSTEELTTHASSGKSQERIDGLISLARRRMGVHDTQSTNPSVPFGKADDIAIAMMTP
ncbi:MAG: protein phosphatase 2C domain-containing protein [Planctomycetota bacterium]